MVAIANNLLAALIGCACVLVVGAIIVARRRKGAPSPGPVDDEE
jgi:hypothetical protein